MCQSCSRSAAEAAPETTGQISPQTSIRMMRIRHTAVCQSALPAQSGRYSPSQPGTNRISGSVPPLVLRGPHAIE
jgi:hypothetical protein